MSGGEITQDQGPLLDFLRTPGVLGTETPKLIGTACAQVLLTGERAYKLKRAIRYDYLDFGTLEQRNAAVSAELTLNRRTAPDLYLGLLPVFAEGDGFRLGRLIEATDPGAVEHLIVMRRFNEDATFDRLVAVGQLTGHDLERLADAIARFHAAAPAAPLENASERLKRVSARTMNEILAQRDVIVQRVV